MGAMKNAVKRKTHKERSQPLDRRRFGLLEKKKDYKLRARDFHQKEEALQSLRKKAEEKNPDEFYFGMQNVATKDGVHIKESAEANKYSQVELRLMKTQDIKYIALKAQTEAKKVEKLQQRLHLVGGPSQPQHTVFVDDEAELRDFDAAVHFQTPPELLARTHNRPREEQLRDGGASVPAVDPTHEARLNRYKAAAYKELEKRGESQAKLLSMATHMGLKKELMGKGHKTKIKASETGGRPVYKWLLERKK